MNRHRRTIALSALLLATFGLAALTTAATAYV